MHSQKEKTLSPLEKNGIIPDALYKQIERYLPIVSVEALISINGAFLFLRRNNQPARGEWWLPGGRIRKGESFEKALRREIKEETGLGISDYKLINVYSRIFPERHDITIAYLCKCIEGKIRLNDEHSEYQLFSDVPADLNPYLIRVIEDSRIP